MEQQIFDEDVRPITEVGQRRTRANDSENLMRQFYQGRVAPGSITNTQARDMNEASDNLYERMASAGQSCIDEYSRWGINFWKTESGQQNSLAVVEGLIKQINIVTGQRLNYSQRKLLQEVDLGIDNVFDDQIVLPPLSTRMTSSETISAEIDTNPLYTNFGDAKNLYMTELGHYRNMENRINKLQEQNLEAWRQTVNNGINFYLEGVRQTKSARDRQPDPKASPTLVEFFRRFLLQPDYRNWDSVIALNLVEKGYLKFDSAVYRAKRTPALITATIDFLASMLRPANGVNLASTAYNSTERTGNNLLFANTLEYAIDLLMLPRKDADRAKRIWNVIAEQLARNPGTDAIGLNDPSLAYSTIRTIQPKDVNASDKPQQKQETLRKSARSLDANHARKTKSARKKVGRKQQAGAQQAAAELAGLQQTIRTNIDNLRSSNQQERNFAKAEIAKVIEDSRYLKDVIDLTCAVRGNSNDNIVQGLAREYASRQNRAGQSFAQGASPSPPYPTSPAGSSAPNPPFTPFDFGAATFGAGQGAPGTPSSGYTSGQGGSSGNSNVAPSECLVPIVSSPWNRTLQAICRSAKLGGLDGIAPFYIVPYDRSLFDQSVDDSTKAELEKIVASLNVTSSDAFRATSGFADDQDSSACDDGVEKERYFDRIFVKTASGVVRVDEGISLWVAVSRSAVPSGGGRQILGFIAVSRNAARWAQRLSFAEVSGYNPRTNAPAQVSAESGEVELGEGVLEILYICSKGRFEVAKKLVLFVLALYGEAFYDPSPDLNGFVAANIPAVDVDAGDSSLRDVFNGYFSELSKSFPEESVVPSSLNIKLAKFRPLCWFTNVLGFAPAFPTDLVVGADNSVKLRDQAYVVFQTNKPSYEQALLVLSPGFELANGGYAYYRFVIRPYPSAEEILAMLNTDAAACGVPKN